VTTKFSQTQNYSIQAIVLKLLIYCIKAIDILY